MEACLAHNQEVGGSNPLTDIRPKNVFKSFTFTHSSVWLERSTVNRDVGGSNPPGWAMSHGVMVSTPVFDTGVRGSIPRGTYRPKNVFKSFKRVIARVGLRGRI